LTFGGRENLLSLKKKREKKNIDHGKGEPSQKST